MGRIKAFSVAGLDLRFFSNDHPPAHFHVIKRGRWEIRVSILASGLGGLVYTVKYGKGPSGSEERELLALVVQHREDLIIEWETQVTSES